MHGNREIFQIKYTFTNIGLTILRKKKKSSNHENIPKQLITKKKNLNPPKIGKINVFVPLTRLTS